VFVERAEEMSTDRGGMYSDGFADLLGAILGESDVAESAGAGVDPGDQITRLHPFQLMRQPRRRPAERLAQIPLSECAARRLVQADQGLEVRPGQPGGVE
jgi:hypothetical protein